MDEQDKRIYRSIALPLRAFDYLKQTQRKYLAKHGIKLSNADCLAVILMEHQRLSSMQGRER